MIKRMKVTRIKDEGDRLLFYGAKPDYYVVGSHKSAPDVKVGDTISYQPYGWNFGFFNALMNPTTS